jgi:hypothetical protein
MEPTCLLIELIFPFCDLPSISISRASPARHLIVDWSAVLDSDVSHKSSGLLMTYKDLVIFFLIVHV